MGFIKDFIMKKFLLGWLKGALDKIPADGKKTLVGILILILSAVMQVCSGGICPLVGEFYIYLQTLPYDDLINTGLGTMIIGLVHKILKMLDGKEKEKQILNDTNNAGA